MFLSHLPTVSSQSSAASSEYVKRAQLDDDLANKIVDDIGLRGYSITEAALPKCLAMALYQEIKSSSDFSLAAVGRENSHQIQLETRSDRTLWIEGSTPAQQTWLSWSASLQSVLNRQLFLGLFSFESHFAHYPVGAYYKTHVDAFKGGNTRKLSLIAYLNPVWEAHWGGELELQLNAQKKIKILPSFATLVAFLSEDFPHQVLPASQSRYSVAGWFRVNA
ncbi:2OG-Fe(II) oxygenase [Aliikangiella sp. IMCC44632]